MALALSRACLIFRNPPPKREEFTPFCKEETEDLFALHPWPQQDPCRRWWGRKVQPHLCSYLPGASWACVPLGAHCHMTRYDLYCFGGVLSGSKGICFAYVVLIRDHEGEFVFGDFLKKC